MSKSFVSILAIGIAVLTIAGCGSADTSATKEQENAFRNPPKNPPPGLGPKAPPAQAPK